MNNYEELKNGTLEYMASILWQVSNCSANKKIEELPTKKQWEEYLKGNEMMFPFEKLQ